MDDRSSGAVRAVINHEYFKASRDRTFLREATCNAFSETKRPFEGWYDYGGTRRGRLLASTALGSRDPRQLSRDSSGRLRHRDCRRIVGATPALRPAGGRGPNE